MSDEKKKDWPSGAPPETTPTARLGQRRGSRIVHDERGNARIEWEEESAAKLLDDRIPLEIVDDEAAVRGLPTCGPQKREKGWNPYQSVSNSRRPEERERSPSTRKDLRKLSEWIKLKRQLEERKVRGEEGEVEDEE